MVLKNEQAELPLISIVMPTYKHGHIIGRALNSLLKQTYKNWEVIVINNYSPDNTEEVVNSFCDSRIRLINFSNGGIIAASRNVGISHATGEFVAFLDSDDWWYPKKLTELSRFFAAYDVIFHSLDIHTINGKKLLARMYARALRSPVFLDLITGGNALPNSSVLARRALLEQAGKLCEDSSIVGNEDFDLWLRLSLLSERFIFCSKILGAYWQGNANVSEYSDKGISVIKNLYARHFDKLSKEKLKQAEYSRDYSIAVTLYKMNKKKEARKIWLNTIKSEHKNVRVKSFIRVVQSFVSCL